MMVETRCATYGGVAILFLSILAPASYAEPYAPTSDEMIIERLRQPSDPVVRELRAQRADLAKHPQAIDEAVDLAARYIAIGRERSQPRYYGYAQSVLAPWWPDKHAPVEVLLLRANILQYQHKFNDALVDLDRALQTNPRHIQAWLTRATVLEVLADYPKAIQSCAALRRIAEPLVWLSCMGSVTSAAGNGAASNSEAIMPLLKDALKAAPDADQALRRWAHMIFAELAWKSGSLDIAENNFKNALALGDNDRHLLASYADFLLAEHQDNAVISLLNEHTQIDGLLLRLAIAEQQLGLAQTDVHISEIRSRFAALERRGESPDPTLVKLLLKWEEHQS